MHTALSTTLTVSALLLASCGGGGVPSDTTPPDTTPPSVLGLTPGDQATGVAQDATIVITFSEPMNRAATQAAYQSAELPAGDLAFSWNDPGTELTLTPKANLQYTAAGKVYALSLDGSATDLAGNALPAFGSSFRTLRQLSTTLSSAPALDGWVRSDGAVNTDGVALLAGDSGTVDNATYRSYLSFDLAALTGATVVSATLGVHQSSVTGTPYTSLDVGSSDLRLDHVNYGVSLTSTDFDPTVYATLGDISSSSALGAKSLAVLGALNADLAAGRSRSQYRLRFAALTDGDGQADFAWLHSGDHGAHAPTLEVTYLTP
ncbi:Ig-like domain-containing protein [Deinococcus koreensis]|uniref:SbsA Ig-like domain-containing protein n=1 Tax=Deinococcus koreensis TaxID=2054903 RepID=A0A2K3UTN4_9DEIO|nr:Ig-like domain-containing protein [Deinococcus koreensis]PNY79903.1 hypothetical protein CVO96_18385 [Deinococcus koreensis]